MNFNATLNNYRKEINKGINELLPSPNAKPSILHEAMHYSMQAGGKRLRPILLITAHNLVSSNTNPMPAAVAVECIHTYSLIHDDLPCMDNADQRRGQPTSHKQFDEASALLAGDALLTYAFELVSKHYSDTPDIANSLTLDLANAAGSQKLIGGQMLDLLAETQGATHEALREIHLGKTAAMITSSITMGLRLASAPKETIEIGKALGKHLGLAFQIADDILDCTADSKRLGKDSGKDSELNKMTYPSLLGMNESQAQLNKHTESAIELCKELGGNNRFLLELIQSLETRVA